MRKSFCYSHITFAKDGVLIASVEKKKSINYEMLRRLQNNNKIHKFMLKLVNLKSLLYKCKTSAVWNTETKVWVYNMQFMNSRHQEIRKCKVLCSHSDVFEEFKFNSLIKNLFNYKNNPKINKWILGQAILEILF